MIPIRPVFLIRDPIERVISSQSMKLRKRGELSPDEEIASLRSLIKNCQNKSRFAIITRRLWAP